MQNTDDLNLIASFLTIKNNMAANIHLPITMPNIATISSFGRDFSQLLKTTIQHGEIFVSLLWPPMLLGVAANVFKISHCPFGKTEYGH